MMKITCRYFASVREQLGMSEEIVELPDSVQTVGQVREHLAARGEVWETALAAGRVLRMALNHQMTDSETLLESAANGSVEVAFFPPVTGG